MKTAHHPPGPKGNPWGHYLAFNRDPIGLLMRTASAYGDLAHIGMGPFHTYLFNHPDYIRDVLVTQQRNFVKSRGSIRRADLRRFPRVAWLRLFLGEGLLSSEGEVHRRDRRLLQSAFHPQKLATYGAVMTDYGARALDRWQDGSTVDMTQEMTRLTLSIVGKALFGAELESETEELSNALSTILRLHGRITMPLAILFRKLPLPTSRLFRKAVDRLHVTISRCVHERQVSGIDRDDLLSLLLRAQDTESDGGGMTDEHVRDHMRTFSLAGYFTTTNALTWTWYLLSQHPEVEAKLHAELDSVLAGKLPTVDDLKKLPYLEMVFAEVLRLYPPIWIMPRWTLNDHEIDGYIIPANSLVVISQYVTHHDARYFPDPFRFDPQRWTPEAKAERPTFAYFPFGGGPRQCIGEGFAWLEGRLVIATLAQHWQMRLVPGTTVEIEAQASTTLRPKHGMWMTLKQRTPVRGLKAVG